MTSDDLEIRESVMWTTIVILLCYPFLSLKATTLVFCKENITMIQTDPLSESGSIIFIIVSE